MTHYKDPNALPEDRSALVLFNRMYNSLVAAKRETKRGAHPNSLANLEKNKIQPGEVRNPTGVNGRRPYSDAMAKDSTEPIPEYLRRAMNIQIKANMAKWLGLPVKQLKRLGMGDYFPEGVTWAEANSLRLHLNSVLQGDVRSAVECRESVEGRATQRIEINRTNDRLKQLIGEYEFARLNPPKLEPAAPANGESQT
jgi:hypothetical protein